MTIQWVYFWESPDPAEWISNDVFDTYEAAVDSAIWHARNTRKRKRLYHIPPDKKQRVLVWKSLRLAGWRIRRKKKG